MPKYLVGGIPTPLKNDGVRQLGWFFYSQPNGKSFKIPWFHTNQTIVIPIMKTIIELLTID